MEKAKAWPQIRPVSLLLGQIGTLEYISITINPKVSPLSYQIYVLPGDSIFALALFAEYSLKSRLSYLLHQQWTEEDPIFEQ